MKITKRPLRTSNYTTKLAHGNYDWKDMILSDEAMNEVDREIMLRRIELGLLPEGLQDNYDDGRLRGCK